MAESVKFAPAFFLDVVERGAEYPAGGLPLRITLFPPVQEPYDSKYGVEMKRVLNPIEPFDVTVGEDDHFGPNNDQLVMRIEPSQRLQKVHNGLVFSLGTLLHDETFRRPYNPHISVEDLDQVKTGSEIHIGGFSIVEKVSGGPWIVRDKIGFGR